ncbi:hypothetical protein BGZ83_009065 [Gryganskiella cystojenkinii]|nr:hypothetical protein BGZ83_009065 [Gryganskiella cystojenkinii]
MATDMASAQGFQHYAARDQREPSLSSSSDLHHANNSNNNLGSTTDQDALMDLIIQQVPVQKREMLSTSWSKDYLNRLTSLPARALQNEPEKLREEQLKVERDMSELAFRDYKAFILVKDCKQEVQSTFEQMGQHLDRFQETIPNFVETLNKFSGTIAPPILERQSVYSSILATHSQLLEVLEIPLLMETCVRNGYYNEALELASHVQRLVLRYPGIGIIQEIEVKVAQGKEMMLVQLLAQLREPIKLPVALRIIGFLRRIGSFNGHDLSLDEDDHHHSANESQRGTTTTTTSIAVEDETPLKMLFLKSRGLYMDLQLSKIVHYKNDSFGFLKKYIDVTRECLFDIMTYYRSIFGSIDNYSGFSSSLSASSYGSPSSSTESSTNATATSSHYQKQHCWTTDNLLSDFVTYRTQTLLQTLHAHIPQIHDTSALSSLLTQLMYLGANMAKIGFDLRYLVTSLFEEAVIRVVGGQFERGADEFLESLGGEGRHPPDWQVPSQWMLGGTGRVATSTSSPSSASSPTFSRASATESSSSGTSMSPQTCLMDYPSLAYLANAYLSALNSLRLLAPLSVALPLRHIMVESLTRIDLALEEYDRFIFGDRRGTPAAAFAFRSRLLNHRDHQHLNGHSNGASAAAANGHTTGEESNLPTSSSYSSATAQFRLQGMEGSVVLNEQKIMDGFLVVYKRAVQDYILKCFDEGIYGGMVPHPALEEDEVEQVKTVVKETEVDTTPQVPELVDEQPPIELERQLPSEAVDPAEAPPASEISQEPAESLPPPV